MIQRRGQLGFAFKVSKAIRTLRKPIKQSLMANSRPSVVSFGIHTSPIPFVDGGKDRVVGRLIANHCLIFRSMNPAPCQFLE
jgi:hypothetical protein